MVYKLEVSANSDNVSRFRSIFSQVRKLFYIIFNILNNYYYWLYITSKLKMKKKIPLCLGQFLSKGTKIN